MYSKGQSEGFRDPRRKMRKGTRSCIECRRRKTRCIFDVDQPDICNECRLRRLPCVSQEHSQLETGSSIYRKGDSVSRLRERVLQLESTVSEILKRLDGSTSVEIIHSPFFTPTEHNQKATNSVQTWDARFPSTDIPFLSEPEIAPADAQIGNSPIFQLFKSDMLSHHIETIQYTNTSLAGPRDYSPKAAVARASLVSLLPPDEDLAEIISASKKWWSNWQNKFPEICEEWSQIFVTGRWREVPMSLADFAKALLCLCISIDQLPLAFNFTNLQAPLNPQDFTERCIAEIDRLVGNDNYAATLPGIECQLLLSKLHLNQGRPRKCWLSNRRAIEFAQLAGLHLSTAQAPPSEDALFRRRLKVWCSLVSNDRFLSFLLGMPYAIADAAFTPQIELCQLLGNSLSEDHSVRLAVILGKLIDRNQDPGKLSIPTTLHLDQELEDIALGMPASWWNLECDEHRMNGDHHSRIMVQITHHMVRAIIHMPFMLKPGKIGIESSERFQYCHSAALKSARRSLTLFKLLRAETTPFLCKVHDLLAFMMALLLVMNLFQAQACSSTSFCFSKEDEQSDWDLVRETTDILRRGGNECGGTVAAESANVLSEICASALDGCKDLLEGKTCKITVPYFGTITVGPGQKTRYFLNNHRINRQETANMKTANEAPTHLTTSSSLNPRHPKSARTDSIGDYLANPAYQAGYSGDTWIQLQNVPMLPNTGFDLDVIPGLPGYQGQETSPNLNMDLGLDQDWNIRWFDEKTE